MSYRGYSFYLCNVELPIPPESLEIKVNSGNKTYNLVNEGQINVLKSPELTEISFDCILPNVKYSFANYIDCFHDAYYYLSRFEECKVNKDTTQFIVIRLRPDASKIFKSNITVSIEDYTIKEDADNGNDMTVSITLKAYREYGLAELVQETTTSDDGETTAKVKKKKKRKTKKTKKTTYTVKKGDCLWNIAKKFYGDGSKWKKIYNANKDKIKNPDLIYVGQKLKIPKG